MGYRTASDLTAASWASRLASPGLSAVADVRLTYAAALMVASIPHLVCRPVLEGSRGHNALVWLFRNPAGYCPVHSTGIACPVGLDVSAGGLGVSAEGAST